MPRLSICIPKSCNVHFTVWTVLLCLSKPQWTTNCRDYTASLSLGPMYTLILICLPCLSVFCWLKKIKGEVHCQTKGFESTLISLEMLCGHFKMHPQPLGSLFAPCAEGAKLQWQCNPSSLFLHTQPHTGTQHPCRTRRGCDALNGCGLVLTYRMVCQLCDGHAICPRWWMLGKATLYYLNLKGHIFN